MVAFSTNDPSFKPTFVGRNVGKYVFKIDKISPEKCWPSAQTVQLLATIESQQMLAQMLAQRLGRLLPTLGSLQQMLTTVIYSPSTE